MANSKRYSILLSKAGSSHARKIHFTARGLLIAGIGAVMLIGLIVFGLGHWMGQNITRQAMAEVLDENRILHSQIQGFSTQLDEVRQEMDAIAVSDDQLRLLADLPRIDKDIRNVGVGGAIAPDIENIKDPRIRDLAEDLNKMECEIRLQKDSFTEIDRRIRERADMIAHTPSIRPINSGYLTSGFGRRRDPFNGRPAFHNGIDISVERGTPVIATASGQVIFAKSTPGLGKLVIIDHGYGFRTAYGHLSNINVSKGQSIERGQRIGASGNTGRSTAPHLHYEVYVNGDPVDGRDYFFDDRESVAGLMR